MIPLDEQGRTLAGIDDFSVANVNPGPFIGGTTNARGDHDGTSDPTTLFTVTGTVLVRIFAVCKTTLVGAATIEVGIVGATAALIAQLADATVLVAEEVWHDATPTTKITALSDVGGPFIVPNGNDIIETIGTANITAGEVEYICLWKPLSHDGKVEAQG